MTTPAIQEHKPRELTDVLIADRERLRKWITGIQTFAHRYARDEEVAGWIEKMCAMALNGADPP